MMAGETFYENQPTYPTPSFLRKFTTATAFAAAVGPQIVPPPCSVSAARLRPTTEPPSASSARAITASVGISGRISATRTRRWSRPATWTAPPLSRVRDDQRPLQERGLFHDEGFREILARKDIDTVMISRRTTGTRSSASSPCRRQDVQCEKPTLTIDEGKLLIKAVRKHKKVFQRAPKTVRS